VLKKALAKLTIFLLTQIIFEKFKRFILAFMGHFVNFATYLFIVI